MSKTKTLHKLLFPALTLLLTLILMSALQRSAQAATHIVTAWTAINVTDGDTVTTNGATINSTVTAAPIVVDTSGGPVAFTLKNIDLTANGGQHVIYITGDNNCTITLEGTVKLKATGDLTVSIWHYGAGDIIIKGTAAAGSAFIGGSYGIVANKNVTIASDAVINGKIEGASGIHSSTGDVTIDGTTGDITGVTSGSGIHASAGNVTITGTTGAITGGTSGSGIQANGGSVTIGATARITGEIRGGNHGIFANGTTVNVTIDGTTAAITGGASGDGIRASGTNSSVTIGATARITGEIKGGQCGIYSDKGDVTISGTTGAITGTSLNGIYADDDVTISGPVASISGSANVVYARSGYAILDYSGSLLDTAKLYPASFFTVDFNYGTTEFRGPVKGYFTNGSKIPAFTAARAGTLLEGWYKNSGLSIPWNFSSDTVTDSITLYAEWDGTASTDASLSNLTVSVGTLDPVFDSGIYAYTVSVENDVMSINITATATDSTNATILGDGTHLLSVGTNEFKVTVYAEDLYTHEEYIITVTRAAPPPPPAPPPGGPTTPTKPATPTTPAPETGDNKLTTPEDQPPVVDEDGNATLPGGGTLETPGGGIIDLPAGTTIDKDGNVTIGPGGAAVTFGGITLGIREDTVLIFDEETPLGYLAYADNQFVDVYEDDWFYDYAMFAYIHGLMQGTSTDPMAFSPNVSMTRAMFVTVLMRIAGESGVEGAMWYDAAVTWARAAEVAGAGEFRPDDAITREEMAVMMYRFMQYMGVEIPDVDAEAFADEDEISADAREAVCAIRALGVIEGRPGNVYDPQGVATRAEVSAVFMRFLEAMG